MGDEKNRDRDKTDQELIVTHVEAVAGMLGLRQWFLPDLLFRADSDWSFLIKTYAFLETLTVVMLVEHLGKPELRDFFAESLEMSQRIKMAHALGLISDIELRMMQALGKMRNTLAHNAAETDFTFARYFENKDRKRSFADNLAYWPDKVKAGDAEIPRVKFVERSPRFAVWGAVMSIASHTLEAKLTREYNETLQLALEGLQKSVDEVEPADMDEVMKQLNGE